MIAQQRSTASTPAGRLLSSRVDHDVLEENRRQRGQSEQTQQAIDEGSADRSRRSGRRGGVRPHDQQGQARALIPAPIVFVISR